MNRYLTTYTIRTHDDGQVTVPPSSIDGDDVGEETYPSLADAMNDLFDGVIVDEMPCRVVFNFEREGHHDSE